MCKHMGPLKQRGEIAAISRYCLIVLLSMALKKYYITLTCSISFITFSVLPNALAVEAPNL